MRKDLVLAVVLAALAEIACTSRTPAVNTSAAVELDTAAIRKAGQARMAAISSGNVEGYLAAYADDAVWMPPNAEDLVGKAIAAKRLAGVMDDTAIRVSIEAGEQTVMSPDWVLERGKYIVVRTAKAGGASDTQVGTYVTVWKRQADQSFKIAYDIWHSDRPPVVEK